MINDLDLTIHELLRREMPEIADDQVAVSFQIPTEDWASKLGSTPTINCFLYDVRDNPVLRQHQWEAVNGNEPGTKHQQKRTPLRMDCFYLITAWSPADERTRPFQEHRLLSDVLMALARHPILNLPPDPDSAKRTGRTAIQVNGTKAKPTTETKPAEQEEESKSDSFLQGSLNMHQYEIRARIASHDVMTNPAELWSSLNNTIKAGFSYVVTLPIDPWKNRVQEAEQISTFIIDPRQSIAPRQTPQPETAVDPRLVFAALENDKAQQIVRDALGRSGSPQVSSPDKERADKGQAEKDGVERGKTDRGEPETQSAPKPVVTESISPRAHSLGGQIRLNSGLPPKDILHVEIMDQALYENTTAIGVFRQSVPDRDGRFAFRRLSTGAYVLQVKDGKGVVLHTQPIVLPEQRTRASPGPMTHIEILLNSSDLSGQPEHSEPPMPPTEPAIEVKQASPGRGKGKSK